MVHTRRTAQLAAEDDPGKPANVKPSVKRERSNRPVKRARKGQPTPVVTATNSEPKVFEQNYTGPSTQPRKVRQKKEHAVPKPSDFPPRVSSAWKVGAHVSAAGGVENTVVNAARVRANAFALFVKSQRKWSSPPLTDENIVSFKARMNEFGYEPKHVLPHGSYLINLANPDETKREKSYECLLDDLRRCEQLGLMFYNFHPGSTVGNATKEESISLIAQCINRAHKATSSVVIVIENMSGAKNIIGSQLSELRDIIKHVEDKSRVGVCLDTCHLHAAGYDISTKAGWDETMAIFDEQIGLSYLCGMHLNDSKTLLGSRKDRHENIGLGTLKLPAFLTILSDPRVQDIPLILETPTFEAVEVWEAEIKVLNALSEVDARLEGKDTERETALKGMVDDIRSVIREYHDNGKKNLSKARTRKRKTTDTDEEDEATSSDDVRSCAEHSN